VTQTAIDAGIQAAGAELKRQAVGLAQGWQSLRKAAFHPDKARPVLVIVKQLVKLTERLKLGSLQRRAGEIEAALRMMVEAETAPSDAQLRVLEAALSALASSAMTLDLSVFKLDPSAAANESSPPPVVAVATPWVRKSVDRVVLLRADKQFLGGLQSAIAEQGVELLELDSPLQLAEYLRSELPTALVIDARFLSALGRVLPLLRAQPGSGEQDSRIVVASARRDIGRKLLAMRNGAHAYFEEPVDLLRMLAAMGFEQRVSDQTQSKPVVLVSKDQSQALEQGRWLLPLHVTVRVAEDVVSAEQAVRDMHPALVVIDDSIGVEQALALGQWLRVTSLTPDLPLILTAHSNSLNERERAVAVGFDEYLLKPVRPRHLVGVVQSRITRAERMQAARAKQQRSQEGLLKRDALVMQAARPLNKSLARAVAFVTLDAADRLHVELGLIGLGQLDRQLAQVMRSAMAPTDLIASFQDNMFLLVLERSDRDALFAAADRIRMAVAHGEFPAPSGARKCTVSVGLCESLAQARSAEEAVHNARAASIASAELGGNRCLWFDPQRASLSASSGREERREAGAASELARGEQPEADLVPLLLLNGKLQSQYWLRLRWPATVPGFPMLDHHAKMHSLEGEKALKLDRQSLELALEIRARELKRGKQIRLFIDLSSASVATGALSEWLAQMLGERRQSGTGLTLCFDAAVGLDHHEQFVHAAPSLTQLGVRLALTGLGRDMALLHHLRTLPVDFVMLMPEIVSSLSTEGRQPLLETLMRKAREAGCATIVPGVEQVEWLPRLKALRVDYVLSDRLGPGLKHAEFDFSQPLAI
jgi:PleD family two-component response regulator/EAL domain-containing protein (putative c-di-GMP-specific phosphodiesterase class I)